MISKLNSNSFRFRRIQIGMCFISIFILAIMATMQVSFLGQEFTPHIKDPDVFMTLLILSISFFGIMLFVGYIFSVVIEKLLLLAQPSLADHIKDQVTMLFIFSSFLMSAFFLWNYANYLVSIDQTKDLIGIKILGSVLQMNILKDFIIVLVFLLACSLVIAFTKIRELPMRSRTWKLFLVFFMPLFYYLAWFILFPVIVSFALITDNLLGVIVWVLRGGSDL